MLNITVSQPRPAFGGGGGGGRFGGGGGRGARSHARGGGAAAGAASERHRPPVPPAAADTTAAASPAAMHVPRHRMEFAAPKKSALASASASAFAGAGAGTDAPAARVSFAGSVSLFVSLCSVAPRHTRISSRCFTSFSVLLPSRVRSHRRRRVVLSVTRLWMHVPSAVLRATRLPHRRLSWQLRHALLDLARTP
jgi:hypothetical protein